MPVWQQQLGVRRGGGDLRPGCVPAPGQPPSGRRGSAGPRPWQGGGAARPVGAGGRGNPVTAFAGIRAGDPGWGSGSGKCAAARWCGTGAVKGLGVAPSVRGAPGPGPGPALGNRQPTRRPVFVGQFMGSRFH